MSARRTSLGNRCRFMVGGLLTCGCLGGCRFYSPPRVGDAEPKISAQMAPTPPALRGDIGGDAVSRPPASMPPVTVPQRARARECGSQGIELFRQGDYDNAQVQLEEAVALDPEQPRAYMALAKILLLRAAAAPNQQTLARARFMLERALAYDPTLLEASALLQLLNEPSPE